MLKKKPSCLHLLIKQSNNWFRFVYNDSLSEIDLTIPKISNKGPGDINSSLSYLNQIIKR